MKLLVLSPHTDDAELGCGGTICKYLESGDEIRWIVFSNADRSLPEGMAKGTLQNEFEGVLKSYGLSKECSQVFDYDVRNLDQHRQGILEDLVQTRKEYKPDLVIGPSMHDYHQDHQVVAMEMIRAFKASSSIICYELPWNHITFDTVMFSRLEKKHIDKKFEALGNYVSQFKNNKNYFSQEFIYGLAATRGVQCNSLYAEAFEVVRWLV